MPGHSVSSWPNMEHCTDSQLSRDVKGNGHSHSTPRSDSTSSSATWLIMRSEGPIVLGGVLSLHWTPLMWLNNNARFYSRWQSVNNLWYRTDLKGNVAKCVHLSLLSLNRKGRWGTTDDFATSFLHFPCFSLSSKTWRPPGLHSLMLPSYLFLCLPCLLPTFTVPCKMVMARLDEQEHDHTTAVCVSL